MAEETTDLVEVDVEVAAALKHMNSAIENSENFKLCSFESLLHPVGHVQSFLTSYGLGQSYDHPFRLQIYPNLSIPFNKINNSLAIGLKKGYALRNQLSPAL